MAERSDTWTRLLRQPVVPLAPLLMLVAGLLATLGIIHLFLVMPAQYRVTRLQADWKEARQQFVRHVEARRTMKDLVEVLQTIPVKREFVPLALSITDQAKRNGVSLPSLSYRMEPSRGKLATKAVFEGSATGRYEDLRRFISELEQAEELLFIEDLDVVRSDVQRQRRVTFKMRIATYLRPDQGPPAEAS